MWCLGRPSIEESGSEEVQLGKASQTRQTNTATDSSAKVGPDLNNVMILRSLNSLTGKNSLTKGNRVGVDLDPVYLLVEG